MFVKRRHSRQLTTLPLSPQARHTARRGSGYVIPRTARERRPCQCYCAASLVVLRGRAVPQRRLPFDGPALHSTLLSPSASRLSCKDGRALHVPACPRRPAMTLQLIS